MTNCISCGAPLHGGKCEYCGTEYKGSGIVASFGRDEIYGKLTIASVTYDVYLAQVDITDCGWCGRTIDGTLHRHPAYKHEFSLIEI